MCRHSYHSRIGTLSAVMPPPTPSCSRPPSVSKVRMRTLRSVPAGETRPSDPVYAPRGSGSSAAMACSAARFGAPVTEPGGKVAESRSAVPTPSVSSPCTVETRCQTPECGCTSSSSSTVTVPGRQTRDRSLRIRSTIITFSAASLAEARSIAAPVGVRGAVPLIGEVVTRRPRTRRNSSGLKLATILIPGPLTRAAYAGSQCGGHPREERRHRLGQRRMQSEAEVELVEVAAVDPADHLLDRAEVVGPAAVSGLPPGC